MLIFLNNLPFTNFDKSNEQQCWNVHRDINIGIESSDSDAGFDHMINQVHIPVKHLTCCLFLLKTHFKRDALWRFYICQSHVWYTNNSSSCTINHALYTTSEGSSNECANDEAGSHILFCYWLYMLVLWIWRLSALRLDP